MSTKNTTNYSKTNPKNQNLIDLYQKNDFEYLAKSNLKEPIDNNGNTIIHLMAANLDREAFKSLLRCNPKSLSYDVINAPNNKSELPIHKALETVQKNNQNDHSFISYMVNELHANPNIPDSQNRIIINKNQELDSAYIDQSKNKIKELNDAVIKNIFDLSKFAEIKTQSKNSCVLYSMPESSNKISTNNVEFIKKLTNHYLQLQKKSSMQHAGYTGKRIIKNTYSDSNDFTESGENDSFVSRKQNNTTKSNMDYKSHKTFVGGKLNRLINEDEELYEDKIADFEASGMENDSFSTQERNKINKNLDNLFGGAIKKNKNYESNKKSTDDDDSDDNDFDLFSSQDRPRREPNVKVNEMYKSFIKKIMDLLNVDEDTAKLYRSAIKITIAKKNPELKKRENDELKVKEMETIINNKDQLQKILKTIDFNEIKKIMAEGKERGEERRKQIEEQRKNKPKNETTGETKRKTMGETAKSTSTTGSAAKSKMVKKSKVTENGYLVSDEIIFSPY